VLPQKGDEASTDLHLDESALAAGASNWLGNWEDCGMLKGKAVMRSFAVAGCVIAMAAGSATSAMAEDGPDAEDAQVLDVSKQVSGIQKKMDDLIAHGRWATPGKLLTSADCGFDSPTLVFQSWGDDASYSLAPQGDLSASDGWTLSKKASVVSGADPFSGARQSLQLGKGAEAATPAMCVNLDNPTIRFFIRDSGGNGKSNLKVSVLYEDFGGKVKHLTIAKLKASTEWQPSTILPIYFNMLALASPSGVTAVAFELKAEGLQKDETLSISSLYVDPFQSR
jgi:hypothetical protein